MNGARWDWYQATVRAPGIDVHADLLEWYQGSWLEQAPVRLGYGEAFTVRSRLGKHATIQSGGRNLWPNVTGSGEDAPEVARFLRTAYPAHEVTRFDACVDTDGTGSGSWDAISAALLEVADDRREGRPVKVSMHGDWRPGRGEDGRTLYLGAPSSAVRVRAYEKGREVRTKNLPGAQLVPLDAVRVEVQVRPEGTARLRAASVEPDEAWGFSRTATLVAARAFGAEVTRIAVRDLRASNDERALVFMAKQYGAMLERQAGFHGSFQALWEHLEVLLEVRAAPAGGRV